jgi:acetolactate synthase small subunit
LIKLKNLLDEAGRSLSGSDLAQVVKARDENRGWQVGTDKNGKPVKVGDTVELRGVKYTVMDGRKGKIDIINQNNVMYYAVKAKDLISKESLTEDLHSALELVAHFHREMETAYKSNDRKKIDNVGRRLSKAEEHAYREGALPDQIIKAKEGKLPANMWEASSANNLTRLERELMNRVQRKRLTYTDAHRIFMAAITYAEKKGEAAAASIALRRANIIGERKMKESKMSRLGGRYGGEPPPAIADPGNDPTENPVPTDSEKGGKNRGKGRTAKPRSKNFVNEYVSVKIPFMTLAHENQITDLARKFGGELTDATTNELRFEFKSQTKKKAFIKNLRPLLDKLRGVRRESLNEISKRDAEALSRYHIHPEDAEGFLGPMLKKGKTAREIAHFIAYDLHAGEANAVMAVDFLKRRGYIKESIMNEAKMPEWEYKDARGVTHHGHVQHVSDRGGTDVTYFFIDKDTGELSLVSGPRMKLAKAIGQSSEPHPRIMERVGPKEGMIKLKDLLIEQDLKRMAHDAFANLSRGATSKRAWGSHRARIVQMVDQGNFTVSNLIDEFGRAFGLNTEKIWNHVDKRVRKIKVKHGDPKIVVNTDPRVKEIVLKLLLTPQAAERYSSFRGH